jgi:membrane glycosyltransferase
MAAEQRTRQSLAQIERAFHEESQADRMRRRQVFRDAEQRRYARHRERQHRDGSLRFVVLCLILLATAVLVTIAMFETLFLVMG